MTNIGDLLGEKVNKIFQDNLNVGDIHRLKDLNEDNGITPKKGDRTRDKFFIILGFDEGGNIIGGVIINSNINYKLPDYITDYLMPVTVKQFPFLNHNSFIDCSKIIIAERTCFTKDTYRGVITNQEMLDLIIGTIKESPTVNKKELENFGIK